MAVVEIIYGILVSDSHTIPMFNIIAINMHNTML
jgi:hypothetical protein